MTEDQFRYYYIRSFENSFKEHVANSFFADMGIVTAVTDNKRVDVKHIAKKVFPDIEAKLDIVTKDIELLFISSAVFGIEHTVSVGDIVLLIGLRSAVRESNKTNPVVPETRLTYVQETLKAIPIRTSVNSTVKFTVTSAGLEVTFNNISFNEGEDYLAKFNELKSGFDELRGDFNAHSHTAHGVPPSPPSTASIDDAKIDNMRV